MELTFECPHCNQQVIAIPAQIGMTLPCPQCSQAIAVPNPLEYALIPAPQPEGTLSPGPTQPPPTRNLTALRPIGPTSVTLIQESPPEPLPRKPFWRPITVILILLIVVGTALCFAWIAHTPNTKESNGWEIGVNTPWGGTKFRHDNHYDGPPRKK